MKRLLTARDVAGLLKINYRTVLKLRRQGQLPARAIAGTWRWTEQDVQDYIDKQKRTAA